MHEANALLCACLERGHLRSKTTFGNAVTLSPPLTITKTEIHRALAILDAALAEAEESCGPSRGPKRVAPASAWDQR